MNFARTDRTSCSPALPLSAWRNCRVSAPIDIGAMLVIYS